MSPKPERPDYRVEPLNTQHQRAAFNCGTAELDSYLQRQARQDLDRDLAAVFVLTDDGETLAGFYTLSAHSIAAAELPQDSAKKLPRFPLPVTLLGRMAVSKALQGERLGEFLLMHALERAWMASQQVGSWAVVVDAKAGVREFYLKYGFIPFPSNFSRLFLPMRTIEILFAG